MEDWYFAGQPTLPTEQGLGMLGNRILSLGLSRAIAPVLSPVNRYLSDTLLGLGLLALLNKQPTILAPYSRATPSVDRQQADALQERLGHGE